MKKMTRLMLSLSMKTICKHVQSCDCFDSDLIFKLHLSSYRISAQALLFHFLKVYSYRRSTKGGPPQPVGVCVRTHPSHPPPYGTVNRCGQNCAATHFTPAQAKLWVWENYQCHVDVTSIPTVTHKLNTAILLSRIANVGPER